MVSKRIDLKWRPFLTLYYKEVRRFWRVVLQTVLTPMINTTLYLTIFGVSLGASIKLSSGFSYLEFLIPGLIMMGVLNNSFQNSSSSIIGSKFHGDILDLRVVPISKAQVVWAMGFGGLTRGIAIGLVTFFISQVFMYFTQGRFLPVQNPALLLLFLIIGGLSFALLGISVGFRAKTFEHINAIGSFILLPLTYLGGVFFSIENLHPFWKAVSQFNPLFYFINGVRYSVLGISDVSWAVALGFSAICLVVLFVLATRGVSQGSFSRW
jgi:ABC-2 type transport system permease protein